MTCSVVLHFGESSRNTYFEVSCGEKMRSSVFIFASLLFIFDSLANEYTVKIEAGTEDCFYTTVTSNITLEVSYKVRITFKINCFLVLHQVSHHHVLYLLIRFLMDSLVNGR